MIELAHPIVWEFPDATSGGRPVAWIVLLPVTSATGQTEWIEIHRLDTGE